VIIDCHCHAGEGNGIIAPWESNAPLRAFVRRSRQAGIGRTNLFSPFARDYAVANRKVARIVFARPDLFCGFAAVHAQYDAGRIAEIVRTAISRYGFRGIKVHRRESGITREVCDTAGDLGLPVIYDVGRSGSDVPAIASQYPGVNFIIPHLGSFGDDTPAQLALIDHLVRYPNVHADTSGVKRFDLLLRAVRRAGPRKLLFGSDGPWLHPGAELAKVKALIDELKLSVADQRSILGGNFLRLIARAQTRSRRSIMGRRPASPRTEDSLSSKLTG